MKNIFDTIKKHPSEKIKLAVTDIDGVLRGKYMSKEKFLSTIESDFGFCDVVFGWDSADVAYDNGTYTGWHTGYPDAKAVVDINTFRQIPWENNVPFFLADFRDNKNNALEICPRSLLKKITKQALDAGYTPFFSQEFEWFNFQETPQSLQSKKFNDLNPITPGMFGYSVLRSSYPILELEVKSKDEIKKTPKTFFNNLFDWLSLYNIPLEGLHTETGPGVYEAAIQYAEILESADRAVLFKTAVKEIAYRHGIIATFMAKFNENLPGCSGHVHQSLWDKAKKKNLFYDEKDKQKISSLMKSYMAGQLHCLPYILPMLAPTINSYKRLVEGAWAPTTLTWAVDNRTTALRALPMGSKSARLETRVVGSDTNPYLAMAACLASGLYGIKNNLKLEATETIGNGYRDIKNGILPGNLKEATLAMKNSKIARELFGETFVNHFTQSREWEWKQFAKVVTDWELKRYMEII